MKEIEKNKICPSTLYLIATPIGNLADMTERAVKVISEVDFVAAEDTRNTLRLLTHFGISKPVISYYEHNKRERGEEILARLHSGESCALLTDAGMPAISDPGEDLVRLCAEEGITVTAIPGACALICALTLSALSTKRFAFEGFLPVQKKERAERLAALCREERTFILYEAPHKLRATLDDLSLALGADRKIALCRELTKLNEEITRTTLAGAVAIYREKEPRGEYVLVIDGGSGVGAEKPSEFDLMSAREVFERFCAEGMKRNDAIKAGAKALSMTRNEFYAALLENDEKN